MICKIRTGHETAINPQDGLWQCIDVSFLLPADFKVGRYLSRSEYAVQADGSLMPLRWMAPETLEDNKFTAESCVW